MYLLSTERTTGNTIQANQIVYAMNQFFIQRRYKETRHTDVGEREKEPVFIGGQALKDKNIPRTNEREMRVTER